MRRLKVPRAIRAMRFFVLPVLAVPTTRKCEALTVLRDGVVETRVNYIRDIDAGIRGIKRAIRIKIYFADSLDSLDGNK